MRSDTCQIGIDPSNLNEYFDDYLNDVKLYCFYFFPEFFVEQITAIIWKAEFSHRIFCKQIGIYEKWIYVEVDEWRILRQCASLSLFKRIVALRR